MPIPPSDIKFLRTKCMLILLSCLSITLLILFSTGTARAAGTDLYTSGIAFYKEYGTGKLVFHEGACYYASRGKAGSGGSSTGIRYGVLGMRFSINLENMGTYDIGIALEDSDTTGSCKRISYELADSYYHSLYKIEYDDITHRLSAKYPELNTNQDLYNQKVVYTVDFYLCVIKNGEDQGDIVEKSDGTIKLTGTVYSDAASIKAAASWSSETMKALESYFGKQVEVLTPSKWYIDYIKPDAQTRGSMESQTFYYGTGQKLYKNQFTRSHTLHLITDDEQTDSYEVDESFLGWLMEGSQTRLPDTDYGQQEYVKDFSKINDTRYKFRPAFEPGSQVLPEASRKSFIFLGWSREQMKDFSRKPGALELKEMEESGLLKSGQSITVSEDMNLYAVWARKYSYIKFNDPLTDSIPDGNGSDGNGDGSGEGPSEGSSGDTSGDPSAGNENFQGTFHYNTGDMATIYSIVSRILTPGREMIQNIISGGYTKNGRGWI